jgi:hypothetical protein
MVDIDEQVEVFVVRCPLGDECSKKQGILGKKLDELEARMVIKNHLTASPYHELPDAEAENMAMAAVVESWHEKAEVHAEAARTEEGEGWYNSRKRGRTGTASAAGQGRDGSGGSSGSGRPSSSTLALAIGARSLHAKAITLPRAQLKACVDSLKRARLAAESAGQLCGRASRAFYEEAACITGCQDVLESYLAE